MKILTERSQMQRQQKLRRNILNPEFWNKLTAYVNKARKKIPSRNWRLSVGYRRIENQFNEAVYKEFKRQGRETIKFINKKKTLQRLERYSRVKFPDIWEKKIEPSQRRLVDKWIKGWSKDVKSEKMEKVLDHWIPKAATLGGNKALEDLGFKLAFNLKNPELIKEFKKRGAKITGGITKRTLKDFQNILVQSYMEKGISPYEVRKRIKGLFEETYKHRSMAIARTETGAASTTTQHETYKKNGVEKKRWLAFIDDRTRPSHRDANGQTRRVDEPFDIGGFKMMHPMDMAAPPEEVVNCRCAEDAVIGEPVSDEEAWTGE